MNIDIFENVFMLLVAIATLMLSLSRFISMPRRGLLYVTAFFLCNTLSDYYWTVYILVMRQEPEVSGFMANFGWKVAFQAVVIRARYSQRGRGRPLPRCECFIGMRRREWSPATKPGTIPCVSFQ